MDISGIVMSKLVVMSESEFMIFDACVCEVQRLRSEHKPIPNDFYKKVAHQVSVKRNVRPRIFQNVVRNKLTRAYNKILALKAVLSEENRKLDAKRKPRFPLGIKNDGHGSAC